MRRRSLMKWINVIEDHLETGLDGLDTAGGVAGHALQEEQPRLLVQDRVRGSAIDKCLN